MINDKILKTIVLSIFLFNCIILIQYVLNKFNTKNYYILQDNIIINSKLNYF